MKTSKIDFNKVKQIADTMSERYNSSLPYIDKCFTDDDYDSMLDSLAKPSDTIQGAYEVVLQLYKLHIINEVFFEKMDFDLKIECNHYSFDDSEKHIIKEHLINAYKCKYICASLIVFNKFMNRDS